MPQCTNQNKLALRQAQKVTTIWKRTHSMMPIYSRNASDVLEDLSVELDSGLDEGEIRRRRQEHGRNRLNEAETASPWKILVDQFKSLVIAILAVAAIVSFAMNEIVQMLAILAAILLNAVIGFFTEWKAVRSMEALRSLGTVQTRVRRDGQSATVDAETLVPGDIVLLEAGDVVTADLRLIESNGLTCDDDRDEQRQDYQIAPKPVQTLFKRGHLLFGFGGHPGNAAEFGLHPGLGHHACAAAIRDRRALEGHRGAFG